MYSGNAGYNYPLHASPESLDKMTALLHEESIEATNTGIDCLFLDFGGVEGGQSQWSWILNVYLKAAEGTPLQVSFCIDGGGSAEYWGHEIARVLKMCGNHPNFPKYKGKCVIQAYRPYFQMTADQWKRMREVAKADGVEFYILGNVAPWPGRELQLADLKKYLDAFDAFYMFDSPLHAVKPPQVNDAILEKFCQKNNRRFIPCLHPGYYGAWKVANDFYNPFRGFDSLYDTFEGARKSSATWFHVTTWNDLMETAILPRAYTLGLTQSIAFYAKTLKGKMPIAPHPDVLFAYHREEIPGTMLRVEAMSLPCASTSPVVISGVLLDMQGKAVCTLAEKTVAPDQIQRVEWLFPTETLAASPHLVPRVTIKSGDWTRTVTMPAIHFVLSWIQNATVVNMPANTMMEDFPNTLEFSQKENVLTADITFKAPEELRRIVLLRNDYPVGMFTPLTKNDEIQLCVSMTAVPSDIDITVRNGRVLRAVKKGQVKGHPKYRTFDYTENTVYTANSNYGGHGLTFAGGRDMAFTVVNRKGETEEYTAEEIVRERCQKTPLAAFYHRMDMTMLTDTPLKMSNGTLKLNLFAWQPQPCDRFSVRYETVSGKVHLTPPVYPFGNNAKPVALKLLRTATNMETYAECYPNTSFNEFLTPLAELPVRENSIVSSSVSPLMERRAFWQFEGNGEDSIGFEAISKIPETLFTAKGEGKNGSRCLTFDGKSAFRLPFHCFPHSGPARISFWMKPAPINRGAQVIIHPEDHMDNFSVTMTSDARIQLIRGYTVDVGAKRNAKSESMTSTLKVKIGQWNHVEILSDCANATLYINGKEAGRFALTPIRSYGGGKVIIGGGFPSFHPYKGLLDDLFIGGVPVR